VAEAPGDTSRRIVAPYGPLLAFANDDARDVLMPPGHGIGTDVLDLAGGPLVAAAGLIGVAFGSAQPSLSVGARRILQRLNEVYPEEVPTAQNLVTMELREAFRPDFRPRLLEEPASEDFKKWMRTQGYSEYWADSFWASHWTLPSAQQGFEMFHRLRPGRVGADVSFPEEELARLLKQQDVLGFYRNRLTAIAYNPITRVDIRRMRRAGVISKEEVEERYRDVGYSPADAALLAEWTERDQEPAERALSVSLITEAYSQGDMERGEAQEDLRAQGYGDKDLALLMKVLDRRVLKRQLAEAARRERTLRTLRTRAQKDLEKNALNREDYDAQLDELGLAPVEQAEFWASVVPVAAVRNLTIGEVLRLYRTSALDRAAALGRLGELKMRDADAELLLRAEDVRNGNRTRDLTTAQVERLFRDGLVDRDGLKARLLAAGYDGGDAELLVVSQELRVEAAG
jgi:hypothetical protein